MNALDIPSIIALREAFKSVENDESARCVLIFGKGRGFCSGLDRKLLSEIKNQPSLALSRINEIQDVFLAVYACKVPVVMCLHGPCIGAGLDLASLADIRIGSTCTVLSAREVLLGMAPDLGSIPALGLQAWATAALLTGSDIPASSASGFFSAPLFPDAVGALEESRKISSRIAKSDPRVVRMIKSNLPRLPKKILFETLRKLGEGNVALL